MKIGIPISQYAYTPEAYAYEKYLKQRGHEVQLDYELDPNNDINIYFMGTCPFWKKKEGSAIEIHEYQSLSTPPYARLKNLTKKIINRKPNGRIFLNEFVHNDLNFTDRISYIYRDMGVDETLFQRPSEKPIYDIVYCGSISGRNGLIEVLIKLAVNYKIVVVGRVNDVEKLSLQHKNITLLGPIARENLPEIYRNARYGLNYTPDIYPFNIQTSTKTLEYLASGLLVISNRYKWIKNFCDQRYISIVPFEELNLSLISADPNFDLEKYLWENLLNSCNFERFLLQGFEK